MKNAKRNILIFSGVLFSISASWYAWLIQPNQVRLETLQNQINTVFQQVEAATAQLQQFDDLRRRISVMEDSVARLERRLYPREKIPSILKQIARLGRRHGLEIFALYPKFDELLLNQSGSDNTSLAVLPVEIQLEGGYRAIGEFVGRLDRQRFLFSVVRMDLAMTRESYPRVRLILYGRLFLRKARQEV